MSWAKLIKRIDLSRLPCQVGLEYLPDGSGCAAASLSPHEQDRIHITLHVKDVFDGHASEVHHVSFLPPGRGLSDAQRTDWIRRKIQDAFAHEVAECIRLDGKQLYFPHDTEQRAGLRP